MYHVPCMYTMVVVLMAILAISNESLTQHNYSYGKK